jgi:hypothetical protein
VRVTPDLTRASERATHGFFDIFRLYFITSSCRKGIHRSNKADNSLVCRPVAFFYAYLSQSWQVLEVEASEELVIYIILEESK